MHVIADLTDVTAAAGLVGRLVQDDGPFAYVIALSGFLLDVAAEVKLRYPVIFKPVRGASSQGVRKAGSAAELRAMCLVPGLSPYEVEEYVTGDVLHTDGVVDAAGGSGGWLMIPACGPAATAQPIAVQRGLTLA